MDTSPDSLALWDQVLNMQAVIATVAYNGRNLNVWKDSRDSGHIRYYVTPLCELILNSLRVDKNDYAHIYMLRFSIRSWDSSIVKLVEKELINKGHPTSITIKMASGEVNVPCEILPLPMQMVRINAADFMQTYLDLNWRPNQNQPNKMTFELCSSNKDDCNKLLDDAKANPETFLLNTKLKFEFTLKGNRQEYREFKVTSEALSESSFFSELSNKFGNKGYVYLSSGDLNRLSRELVHDVKVNDIRTDGYIEASEENQLIQSLFETLKEQTIKSCDLSKEDWDKSVFWQDDFSRPDIQTEYMNEVFKHDESTDRFIFNLTQDEKFRKKINSRNSSSMNLSGCLDVGVNYKLTDVDVKSGFDYSKTTNSINMNELVK